MMTSSGEHIEIAGKIAIYPALNTSSLNVWLSGRQCIRVIVLRKKITLKPKETEAKHIASLSIGTGYG